MSLDDLIGAVEDMSDDDKRRIAEALFPALNQIKMKAEPDQDGKLVIFAMLDGQWCDLKVSDDCRLHV